MTKQQIIENLIQTLNESDPYRDGWEHHKILTSVTMRVLASLGYDLESLKDRPLDHMGAVSLVCQRAPAILII